MSRRIVTAHLLIFTLISNLGCRSKVGGTGATADETAQAPIVGAVTQPDNAEKPADLIMKSVTVSPAKIDCLVGSTQKFTATALFVDGSTVDVTKEAVWTAGTPAGSTVDSITYSQSTFSCLAPGTFTVSAKTAVGVSGTATLTVYEKSFASLVVTPPSATTHVGQSELLKATGVDSAGISTDVTSIATWTSSKNKTATVSNDAASKGRVTALAAGDTVITAELGKVNSSANVTVLPALLTAINVLPAGASVIAGLSGQFSATGVFGDSSTNTMTSEVLWESSDPAVGTISNLSPNQGTFIAIAVGETTITATKGGVSSSQTVTVTAAALVSLVLSIPSSTVLPLTLPQVTATGTFTDGSVVDVTTSVAWSSSDSSVATVSNSAPTMGRISPVAAGNATITATMTGIAATQDIVVSAAILTAIAVTPAAPSKPRGLTQQFTATGTYSNSATGDVTAAVTWTSSNGAIATVNDSSTKGLATAITMGTATIAATLGALNDSTTLTVTAAVLQTITLSPSTASVPAGLTQQYAATGHYSDGSTADLTTAATWSATGGGLCATISNSNPTEGLATTVDDGNCTVSATYSGITSSAAALTVTAPVLVSLSVAPAAPTVAAGLTQQFTSTAHYSDGTTSDMTTSSTWSSNDTGVATVNNQGLATTLVAGTVTIGASYSGQSASATLNVGAKALVSISVAPATQTLALGLTQQYTATGLYTDATTADLTATATWTSSVPAKATVSVSGLATAVGVGSSSITASFASLSGSAALTVTAASLTSIDVTPVNASIAKGLTQQYAALGHYSDGSTTNLTGSVAWASSAPAKATINSAGLASTLTTGPTTISATSGAISNSTTLTVTAATLTAIAVTPAAPSVALGLTAQLTATGTYTDATTQNLTATVTWSTSDASKATVNSSGLATAIAVGSSTITATSGAISDSETLVVGPAVLTSITVTPANPTTVYGATRQLTATGNYSDSSTTDLTATATWASATTAVATIDSSGLATSAGIGNSTVSATVSGVSGDTVLTISAQALPANPTTLVATPDSTSQITLTWASGGGTTASYQVAYQSGATAPSSCTAGTVLTAASATKVVSGLAVDTQYSFRVCALNTNPSPDASSGATTTAATLPNPPTAPTAFTATAASSTQINLTWADATGETNYTVEWSADGSSGWASVTSPAANATAASDTGLTAITAYYYRIKANNSGGSSAWASANSTTLPNAPGAPASFAATAASQTQISLSWADVTGETSYSVEWSADGSTGWASVSSPAANATAASDAGLTANTTYYYRIKSNNTGGSSAWSTANTSTLPNAPAAPTGFTAAPASSTQINLAWADVATETSYSVEWSADGSTGWASVSSPASNATAASDTSLTANTTYYYRIRANNAGGSSAWAAANTTTYPSPPATPTGFGATAVSATQIDLSWTDGAGETSYTVEWSANGSTGWINVASPGADVITASHTSLTAGTLYYYRVKANNLGGSSAWATANVMTTPAAPGGLSATAASATEINFTWTDVTGETGYTLEWSADGSTGWTSVSSPAADAVAASHSSLTASTVYYYRLRANNSAGSSAWSTVNTTTTPVAPTGFTAAAASQTQINLAWTDVTGETGYTIEWSADGSTGWTNVSSPAANAISASHSSLTANTAYFYRIKANNAGGSSAWSTATTSTLPNAPSAPTGFTATAASATQINLAWSDASGETSYTVEWSANGSTGWASVSSPAANATSANDTGLAANTAYYYRIKANNSGGSSAWATANTTTLPNPPATPTGLSATAASDVQINLTWSDVTTETGYTVEWSANGTSGWTNVSSPAANAVAATHSSLTASTTYYYRIKADNTGGSSAWSSVVTTTTTPIAPTGFTATTASSTQINLAWTDVAGETGYTLEWSANGSTGWTSVSSPAANAVSASHATLTAGTAYYYRLRANNAGGSSGWSTANTVTTPAAPSGFSATAASQTQINLSWTDGTGETSYTVEWSANGSTGWTNVSSPAANAISGSHSSLTVNTLYYYRIRANNAGGSSTWSTANTSTLPNAPSTPTSFAATAPSFSQINLSWTDVATETGYTVEWSPNGSSGWTTAGSPAANATSYSHTGLTSSTTYYYRIKANNSGGSSGYATANATTAAFLHTIFTTSTAYTGNLGGMAGADAKCATQATAAFRSGTWKAVISDSYVQALNHVAIAGNVYNTRPAGSGGGQLVAASSAGFWSNTHSNAINYDENGASTGDVYAHSGTYNNGTIWTAYNCNDWTDASSSFSSGIGRVINSDTNWNAIGTSVCSNSYRLYCIDAQDNTPNPPTGLTVSPANNSSMNLAWRVNSNNTDAFDDTAIKIYRSTDNVTFTLLTTTAAHASTYTDTGLTNGTTYYYKVSALRVSGGTFESVKTAAVSAAASTTVHRIFTTSTSSTGNLGGLSGGDSICQTRGTAASLGGTWKAVLSSAATSAASRLAVNGPVYNLRPSASGGRQLVASNSAGFWSSTHSSAINYDETGASTGDVYAHSGTYNNGTIWTGNHCNSWTDASSSFSSGIGRAINSDTSWNAIGTSVCSNSYRLYCIDVQ